MPELSRIQESAIASIMSSACPAPIEVLPVDISGFRHGNTGIDYVHRFTSGRPGPHVVVNALTHGNEFCGVTALLWLFKHAVRPRHGTLTLSFANVAAYERFDREHPLDSRFIDRDFNRVWSQDVLAGDDRSAEARRARELLPVYAAADALLDIHSTTYAVRPMLVYAALDKARRLAADLRAPTTHIVSPGAKHAGGLLIEYGNFGDADAPNTALVVECGQHFARSSGEVAIQATLRFLDRFGMLERDFAEAWIAPVPDVKPDIYEISEVRVCKGASACFVRQLEGFEEFAVGELIGHDGEDEIRAPYDRCAVIMPKFQLVVGREMVTLARRL
ncbi:MAG TPA: succinylglutamate desuccinylase/aspartoacylase family protein [Alphaproteobacteria bacterium]